MWTVTLDIYFKGITGISYDWDCHCISLLSLWWAEGTSAVALLQTQSAHTPISFPLLPDLLGTLAKPAESSYPFATNEKAGISLQLARGTVFPIWIAHQHHFLPLDVGGQWLFSEFSSFGFTRENTSESPVLEFETLLESTFNIILQKPGFSITPHKLTSDAISAQDLGSSPGCFSLGL